MRTRIISQDATYIQYETLTYLRTARGPRTVKETLFIMVVDP